MPRRLEFGAMSALGEYIRRSGWISVSQVSQVLLNGTDVLVIGALLGPSAVVIYVCTGKLVSVLANQPQAILQSAAPALSELRRLGSRPRLFTVTAALAQATLAVSGLVACVVLAVNGAFVSWWVGAERFGGSALTVLLLVAMVVRHFNTTNVYALFSFGHERRLALSGLADGVATLAVTAALVKVFGMAGAPLGAIAGVVLAGAPLTLGALAREAGVTRRQLLRPLVPWLWRCAVVLLVVGTAGVRLRPASFPALALLGGLAAALYAAAVVPPLLQSSAGAYLRPLFDRLLQPLRAISAFAAAGNRDGSRWRA
jgi:O-antigen/teichoic acid export membrane protein